MSLKLKLASAKKPAKTVAQVILVNDQQKPVFVPHEFAQQIEQLLAISQFSGKTNETVMDYQNGILLVGVGNIEKLSGTTIQKIAKTIYQQLSKWCKSATVYLAESLDNVAFGQLSLAILNSSYVFDRYKSKKTDKPVLTDIQFALTNDDRQSFDDTLALQLAIFKGQSLTKTVANEPPNVCFPAYLAEQAKQLAKAYPDVLTVKVLGEKDMAKLGMNCFLAVSHGSEREGQLVLLEYNGLSTGKTKKSKKSNLQNPIVLVGKGVTFDTGGISLKPALNMGEMKFDMGGAAAVLGTIKSLCEARLPLQVVGALACAENMPSGRATRPGDIVTAMNGKTVEILNTDAEGRLVLCDTLVYVQQYEPKVIIDMATLTGACIVALGHVRSAVYSKDEDLLFDLQQASEEAHDRIWHMPLDDEYQEQLNSNMADMQNIGGMPAGSVTASCFLSRFVEGYAWAHLDIAGTAWQTGKEPNATGRPVPLLMHYLNRQAQQNL